MSLESPLRTIFNEALDHEDPAERLHYIDQACGADHLLRSRLEKLLHAHETAGNFLSETDASSGGFLSEPAPAGTLLEQPGQFIGPYKLLQQIGEGGCGLVYLAEQEKPVRRRVALKIIKLGMDTRSVIARFEAERQALALMDHPNIARVLDAGATETGRPYFVMELVHGVKITDYCSQNNLSTEQRLRLFVQICKAVQHAHTKGIIHRDLKPANILVCDPNPNPNLNPAPLSETCSRSHSFPPDQNFAFCTLNSAFPKVIDFGIAKATGQQRLTDRTLFTAFEQFIGTPAYMSPEQAEMSALDIDTRSDIYSLGVLLYELLTGKPPFDHHQLLTAGLDEMRRIIREVEPRRPSQAFVAADIRRLTSTGSHDAPRTSQIDPDLDWIVMKCLEKDRNRRYETANGLALDIERHLRHEPVTARPPTRLYQFQKLLLRHKLKFAAAAAITATLILALALSTWLYLRERAASRLAEEKTLAAESSARSETKQRIRTEIQKAELLFADDDASRALAYLAGILREQPTNQVVSQRIISALTHRNFCFPLTPPLVHGPALKPNQGWSDKAARHPLITGPSIRSAQFSPDGNLILTASRDGTTVIWDSHSGKAKRLISHADEVFWAQFSPDGQSVVTACRDHQAYLRSVADGQLLTPPLTHEGPITYAQFSFDGERVATASEDGTAKVWSARTGKLLAGPLRHSDTVVTVHFSQDGQWIVTASYDFSARVWNAHTGQPRSRLLTQDNAVFFANFNPSGEMVVAGGFARELGIWDSASGDLILNSVAHRANILSAVFSPNGNHVLSADDYGKVRFWDAKEARILPHHIRHDGAVRSLAISPDGKTIATASADTTARLWDMGSAAAISEPLHHNSPLTLVSFSPDGERLLTVSEQNQAIVWGVPTRDSAALELPQRSERSRVGRFSPDSSKVILGGDSYVAKLWDISKGQVAGELFVDSRYVTAADFSSDGKLLATASIGGLAKIWDVQTHAVRAVLEGSSGIPFVRFSPDGKVLLTSSSDAGIKLWKVSSGELLFALNDGFVPTVDFAPDGTRFVAASARGYAQVWNTESGLRIGTPLRHEQEVEFVRYSRDGLRIVTASKDKTARIWDARTLHILLPPLQHDDAVRSAVFSSDGALILTVSGNSARVWDSRTGRPKTDLLRHKGRVNSAFFSPDDLAVLTSSDDNTARVWDAATGFPISEPLRHSSAVPYAEFSPDGKWVLTIDHSRSAKIWDAPLPAAPPPSWLPALAEAFASQRLNAQREFEHVEPVELLNLKERFLQFRVPDASAHWLHWLFSIHSARTVSPFSSVSTEVISRQKRERDSLLLAESYVVQGQWTNALREYTAALALVPNDLDALLARSYVYEKLKRFPEGEADLRQAIALQPNDPWGYLVLAFYLSENFHTPDKALPLALKAVALAHGNHHALNTLGIVYYRLGQYEKAAETLELAAQAFQADTLAARELFFLAMIWHRLGNSSKAEDYYHKALQWIIEHPRWAFGNTQEDVKIWQEEAATLLGREPAAQ